MRVFIFLIIFFSGSVAFAQDFTSNEERPRVKIDSLYREDQFYIGITYNTMVNGPKDYSKDNPIMPFWETELIAQTDSPRLLPIYLLS